MKSIKIITLVLAIGFQSFVMSQNYQVLQLINEGIELHDSGLYQKALNKYFTALKIQPENNAVLYEIGYTYCSMKNYKKAIKYAKKVAYKHAEYAEPAYVLYGTALDLSGKNKNSIQIYQRALVKYPNNYLLHFNLAVSLVNSGKSDKAIEHLIKTIELNKYHKGSHLLLGKIMFSQKKRIQSLLALYFFLIIEPDSERTPLAYQLLTNQLEFDYNYYKISDEADTNQKKIVDEFSLMDFSLSMSEAGLKLRTDSLQKIDLLQQRTQNLIKILADQSNNKSGFWWDFYITFLVELDKEKLIEPLCYLISYHKHLPETETWISVNKNKLDTLANWLENNPILK